MILILSIYQLTTYSIMAIVMGFIFSYLTIMLIEKDFDIFTILRFLKLDLILEIIYNIFLHPIVSLQKLFTFILAFFKIKSSFIEMLEKIISLIIDVPINIVTLLAKILTIEWLAKSLLWISNIFLLDFSKFKNKSKYL